MERSSDVVFALKNRYAGLPPLLLSRSIERARNEVELFDILDTVPGTFPLVWSSHHRRWLACDLLNLPTQGPLFS
jgi:hypothetical protein